MTDKHAPADMTEQIEASFGPIYVYVSSTDMDTAEATFDDVWETMMETSDKMNDMHSDDDSKQLGSGFS